VNISIFLAKVFGLYLVIMGVSILINRKRIQDMALEMVGNMPLIFIAGVFTLILGILLVLVHNVWVAGWPVVITLLCWLTFLRGAVTVLFPTIGSKIVKATQSDTYYTVVAIISLLLGLWLMYMGFSG